MVCFKCFGMLVGAQGVGRECGIAKIAEIAKIGN
jgi:hypothetical protein